jgi:NAD(P)H dehydrogenase (quinone)
MVMGVFLASGGLGTATLVPLIHKLDADKVALVSRHPDNHVSYSAEGGITRHADFDDPDSFVDAFKGVSTLHLISYPGI